MILSICIPTYNRRESLEFCLQSLSRQKEKNFEVCISDNCSNYNIYKLLRPYKKKLNLKININKKNLGFALNILKVTSMAKGNFIWLLGDDDLLLENAVGDLLKKIKKNKEYKFFWINSFYLSVNQLRKLNKKKYLNSLKNMKRHSNLSKDQKCNFFDLIDKKVSFDFLLGIFVCVFERESWNNNLHVVNYTLLKDKRTWSNFENTCFFIKVFTSAFLNSKVYICVKPLSINLHGVREWSALYPFVEIVRIPEALDYYRSQGLSLWKYVNAKNFALRNFFNYFFKIFLNGDKMGRNYINFYNHFLKNLIYPNAWLSIIYYMLRKVKNFVK